MSIFCEADISLINNYWCCLFTKNSKSESFVLLTRDVGGTTLVDGLVVDADLTQFQLPAAAHRAHLARHHIIIIVVVVVVVIVIHAYWYVVSQPHDRRCRNAVSRTHQVHGVVLDHLDDVDDRTVQHCRGH